MSIQDRKNREFARRGEEILAAALDLFESDNWEQVTVEQIAREAEVGKGTVYKHYASKDEIYARLVINFQRDIRGRLMDVDAGLPVLERFRQHLELAWEMHRSRQALHRLFLYCCRPEFKTRLEPAILAELEQVEAEVLEPSFRLLEDGVKQGLFPDRPPEHLLFGVQSAFWGAMQLLWSGLLTNLEPEQQLRDLTRFALAGLMFQENVFGNEK